MLCKEFQFGDWCCNKHGFPMQITNVGKDYAYATFEGNEGDPWEFNDKDDQPKPIKITRDILKKNGWIERPLILSWDSSVLTYYFIKDEGDTHLEFKRDTLTIWFNYETGNYLDIAIPVIYVHQLQQVLRLAGITEMANNFKI